MVTFGGGATTDLGGFVAATWLRGVRVVHVPTTLLAMVDAAVGGKTGINTAAGKNLVGSFHEPAGVLCDLSLLETLPRADLVAGLGEVVKCGFIADPRILDLVEDDRSRGALTADSPVLRELVERSMRVKVDVVVADLRETGGADGHPGREALNYGHTLAHAIERAEGYTMRHGEAVAIGCVFVAELARRAGRLDDATADRHRTRLRPGRPARRATTAPTSRRCSPRWRVDKKSRGDQLRFVVLEQVGRPVVLAGPDEAHLRGAYEAMSGVHVVKVLVLNGPNLGRLGRRQPEIYGTTTHAELAELCVAWGAERGLEVEVRQTNHEGVLVDWLNTAADDATPGGAQRRRLDPLLLRGLRRLRPAGRAAGRGAPLRPAHPSRGVPAPLGGHRRTPSR